MEQQTAAGAICGDLLSYASSLTDNAPNGEVMALSGEFSKAEIRAKILALQAEMMVAQTSGAFGDESMDEKFPLTHRFTDGAYSREMLIKQGMLIIGKIHKHAHFNFIMTGKVAVLTEDGPMVITAPYQFASTAGTKRVVLALEDTLWTTVHVTNETDLEKIEEHVIAPDYEALALFQEQQKRIES